MNLIKSTCTVSLLIVGLGLAVNGYSQSFLTNGLVAYYPFNGNANDAVGTNNGTVYGATLTTDRFGIPNSAYSFNGNSRIVTINPLPDMQSASASCWITVSAFTGGYVWMEGDTNSGHDFGVPFGKYFICLATKDNMDVCGNLPPLTNRWFHVVAVADNENTNVLKIWLNGQLIATSPSLGNANVGYHSQLYIGCRAVLNDYFFNGVIDDLRFYNRALSASEVQQLYVIESGPRVDLIKAVKPSFSNLTLTTNYQMQISGDLNTWTNQGSPFTATNTSMIYPQYWNVANWNSLFFRLQITP
jgi:hypothetical protein